MTASASFTFATDRVENPLTTPFCPRSAGLAGRADIAAIGLRSTSAARGRSSGFDLFFFDDSPVRRLPPAAIVSRSNIFDGGLNALDPDRAHSRSFPSGPRPGENRLRFAPLVGEPVSISLFGTRAHRFYTGLYGVRPIQEAGPAAASRDPSAAR